MLAYVLHQNTFCKNCSWDWSIFKSANFLGKNPQNSLEIMPGSRSHFSAEARKWKKKFKFLIFRQTIRQKIRHISLRIFLKSVFKNIENWPSCGLKTFKNQTFLLFLSFFLAATWSIFNIFENGFYKYSQWDMADRGFINWPISGTIFTKGVLM